MERYKEHIARTQAERIELDVLAVLEEIRDLLKPKEIASEPLWTWIPPTSIIETVPVTTSITASVIEPTQEVVEEVLTPEPMPEPVPETVKPKSKPRKKVINNDA